MTKRTKQHPEETILSADYSTESMVEPIMTNPEPAHLPVVRQLGVALFLLAFVFGTSYVGTLFALMSDDDEGSDIVVSAKLVESTPLLNPESPFEHLTIQGKSAFVWDIHTQKILFNKNADVQLPLASITKLMTALVAYELLEDASAINITVDAIKADGDSGLRDGEVFSLKSLTDMVLVASSNDGAMALSHAAGSTIKGSIDPDRLFVHAMNLRAKELGLTQTQFKNPTGLDISPTEPGAVSSARDVALLLEYIMNTYPSITSATNETEKRVYAETGEQLDIQNTNEVIPDIDGIIASKTGYTDLAGGNLVVAFDAALNRSIVVVVLGSTYNGRFSDVKLLSDTARTLIARNAP